MNATFSLRLSALLGKEVILTREFAGYFPGAIAVIDEFVSTTHGSFFRVVFKDIPASSEEVEPLMLPHIAMLSNSAGTVTRSLYPFFKRGFPPKDKRSNFRVI